MVGMYSHPSTYAAMTVALKSKQASNVAVSACVAQINFSSPDVIQLTPAGQFRSRDTRPEEVPYWFTDASVAARVLQKMAALKGDVLIDYDHQTLFTEETGKPAPAAGWFSGSEMEWREGEGIYAKGVRWTAAAKAAIESEEYRYISPVFEYDKKTGEVLNILMVAITNFPALEGLGDLTARAAAKFSISQSEPTNEDTTVKREELIAMLGLAATATDTEINTAFAAMKAKAESVEALNTEVTALKAKVVDPSKHVDVSVVEELKKEIAALSGKVVGSEVEAIIAQAQADGKLLPAQLDWAKSLGNSDIAALKTYLEKTPAIAALKGSQTNGAKPVGVTEAGELDETATAVCKQLGIDPEAYKKTAGVKAAA